MARLENAAESLNAEDVSVEGLFGRVAARHSADAIDRSVTLITEVEPGAEIVYGDRFRLEQALQNVTANALRHTPSGGRIELRAESIEGHTRLSVSDTGIGIANAHLPFVFDRFYKVDPSRSAPATSSGLGLSIVKAIVERHRGRVFVSSSEGPGTVFTIDLPSNVPVFQ